MQFGIVRSRRHGGLHVFDSLSLHQAQVAACLKLTLGMSTTRLADFITSFSRSMKIAPKKAPEIVVFRLAASRRAPGVEVVIRLGQLRASLNRRLRLADVFRERTRRPGRREPAGGFTKDVKSTSEYSPDFSPREIARALREYRMTKKQRPKVTAALKRANKRKSGARFDR